MLYSLKELHALTDRALVHAGNNNIAGVGTCIARRRIVLEQCHALYNELRPVAEGVRQGMEQLVEKDRALKQKLETCGMLLREDQEKVRQKRGARARYVGKQNMPPRFIDKKA